VPAIRTLAGSPSCELIAARIRAIVSAPTMAPIVDDRDGVGAVDRQQRERLAESLWPRSPLP